MGKAKDCCGDRPAAIPPSRIHLRGTNAALAVAAVPPAVGCVCPFRALQWVDSVAGACGLGQPSLPWPFLSVNGQTLYEFRNGNPAVERKRLPLVHSSSLLQMERKLCVQRTKGRSPQSRLHFIAPVSQSFFCINSHLAIIFYCNDPNHGEAIECSKPFNSHNISH